MDTLVCINFAYMVYSSWKSCPPDWQPVLWGRLTSQTEHSREWCEEPHCNSHWVWFQGQFD